MRYRGVLMLAAVLLLTGAQVTGRAASPTGAFALTGVPTQGGTATFAWTCSNLPTQGGATIGCFIELTCTAGSQVWVDEIQGAAENVLGPVPVVFDLPVVVPVHATLTCEAYLFWDGYNNPRRRKTNTLAALYFSAD